MIALAVDLGGSHVDCGVVRDRTLLGKRSLSLTHEHSSFDFDSLLMQIADLSDELIGDLDLLSCQLSGVVFGFPGIVSCDGQRVTATNRKFDAALGVDFAAWAQRCWQLPVVLENDARLALMGEQFCGAAMSCPDAALVTLGTGIGVAASLEGRVLRGTGGRAGCLGGHMPVRLGGRLCTCGNLGCAEAEASTWALKYIAKAMDGYPHSSLAQTEVDLNFEILFEHADRGDAVADAVLQHCYQVWGALAVGVFHMYAPEVLLFGGSVMRREAEVLKAIREHVDRYAWDFSGSQVQAAMLGSDAALLGAIPRLKEALC